MSDNNSTTVKTKRAKVGKSHSYKKLRKRKNKINEQNRKRNEKYCVAEDILLERQNHVANSNFINIDKIGSYASVKMWRFLKLKLQKDFPNIITKKNDCDGDINDIIEQEKDLVNFFKKISVLDVKEEEVTKATDAYIFDKFETRIESLFLTLLYIMIDIERRKEIKTLAPLLYLYTTLPNYNSTNYPADTNIYFKNKFAIASIGGACGNDLIGAITFLSSCIKNIKYIDAISYDFSKSWNKSCTLINEIFNSNHGNKEEFENIISNIKKLFYKCKQVQILPNNGSDGDDDTTTTSTTSNSGSNNIVQKTKIINLQYQQCDLKQSINDERNMHILNNIKAFDLFIFSYVVFETDACKFKLLPEILKRSSSNSIFIFLDPHKKTINDILTLISALESSIAKDEAKNGNTHKLFEIVQCKSSSFYQFKGIVLFKVPRHGDRTAI
jgi:hypothetical protein